MKTVRKALDTYASYLAYAAQLKHDEIILYRKNAPLGAFYLLIDGKKAMPKASRWEQELYAPDIRLCIDYTDDINVRVFITAHGIRLKTNGNGNLCLCGSLCFAATENCFAVKLNRCAADIRSAVGPAVSKIDDALFDRTSDCALHFTTPVRLGFDWDSNRYTVTALQDELFVRVVRNVIADEFGIEYRCINKNNTFPTPPVGWMTWYAVMFEANEDWVLKNAHFMKDVLGDYGANVMWIDWEWYHEYYNKYAPDVDIFRPDPKRYPNGLKYVADEMQKLGQIPALWIGPSNETVENGFIAAHPESILTTEVTWCGEYQYDMSNRAYLTEYLPMVAKTIKEWGYKAVKWDCLPDALYYADRYYEYMNTDISSQQIVRNAVTALRNALGESFYMLSCSGAPDRIPLFAADIFDGARIGGDIFSWQNFIADFVARVWRFYPLHNTMLYCDTDNLVIRPEYSNKEQAVTRTSMLSLLGLPITFGDNLTQLPADRVDMLRRCCPALDAHSMDTHIAEYNGENTLVNLCIAKRFEQWNIATVNNLSDKETTVTVSLQKDLQLDDGQYLVYDYWNNSFLGVINDSITVTLAAYNSAVYSVRRLTGKPQVVSTNRHISQGGVDLLDVTVNGNTLSGKSHVIKGDLYTVTAYFNGKIKQYSVMPESTGDIDWQIEF